MAWDPADVISVESAIIALTTGARTARVRHGNDEIEFTQASLADLYKLRDMMNGEIRTASAGTSKVRFNFS